MKIPQLETLMVGTKDFKCNFEYPRKLPKDKGKGNDFYIFLKKSSLFKSNYSSFLGV